MHKLWVRVLISLLAGGIINEIMFLTSGDPTRHRSVATEPNYSIFFALGIYMILTLLTKKFAKKTML